MLPISCCSFLATILYLEIKLIAGTDTKQYVDKVTIRLLMFASANFPKQYVTCENTLYIYIYPFSECRAKDASQQQETKT